MDIGKIIDNVIAAEGVIFTNNPADSGGPTKFGITQAALSAHRGRAVKANEVAQLTLEEARTIYYVRYVVKPGFDRLLHMSPRIAEEVIDTGVNTGPARAAEFLQRALNALNRREADYPDVRVDGACGPATINALRAFLRQRGPDGETVMLRALNCLQGAFYIALAEGRPKDEEFLFGWLKNRVVI